MVATTSDSNWRCACVSPPPETNPGQATSTTPRKSHWLAQRSMIGLRSGNGTAQKCSAEFVRNFAAISSCVDRVWRPMFAKGRLDVGRSRARSADFGQTLPERARRGSRLTDVGLVFVTIGTGSADSDQPRPNRTIFCLTPPVHCISEPNKHASESRPS